MKCCNVFIEFCVDGYIAYRHNQPETNLASEFYSRSIDILKMMVTSPIPQMPQQISLTRREHID